MRTVYKARIVPDSVPDGLAEKVIKVSDLGVPVAAALGRWEALTGDELRGIYGAIYAAGVPLLGIGWTDD